MRVDDRPSLAAPEIADRASGVSPKLSVVDEQSSPRVSARQSTLASLLTLSRFQLLVLVMFFAYAAMFIYESSFVIGGVRYFCLFDDDMISMRYAANFAHHHGLVWNPGGGKVLGFTNLLWVLYMSLFHKLPIYASKMSLCIQASGAFFLALSLFFVRAIAQQIFPGRRHVATLSMVLVAFYGSLLNWSLQGTEVSVATLFVTTSVWLGLRAISHETSPIGLYLLLGISTLCRVDMAVFAGSLLIALTIVQPFRWKYHLIGGGCVIAFFLLAQAAFNFDYYGTILPNTYYLKVTGYPLSGRLLRGGLVTLIFVIPLSPLIGIVWLNTASAGRPREQLILVLPIFGQIAYSIWVGGDAWEWWGGANRYVSIVMPLFFILVASALTYYAVLVSKWLGNEESRVSLTEACTLALLVAGGLFLANCQRLRTNMLLTKPIQTSRPQHGCNEDMVRQALLVRSMTDSRSRIAVVWAGALPYFSERYGIDLLGKNDVKIAHEEMRLNSELARKLGFWPGHLKWDYDYSIGQLKPDIVVDIWGVDAKKLPYLKSDYVRISVDEFRWYVRRDSHHLTRALSDLIQADARPR